MAKQLLAVLSVYLFLAMTWSGRVGMLMWAVVIFGPELHDAHRRGLARLERAGLRRHVDADGVRLEGRRVPSRS